MPSPIPCAPAVIRIFLPLSLFTIGNVLFVLFRTS